MHEGCHVVGALQDLGIHVTVNKVQQLVEHFFDVADLVQIRYDQRVLRQKLLFLLLETLLELILYLLFLIFKLLLQVEEALVNILHLLKFQPLQLLLHLLEQLTVLVIKSLRIENHLLQIKHVLLETARHLLDLYQLMPVVLIEDALHAHRYRT